jgi:catechol 2,3-dioxygenase-like lactoylglutathione lyase family enzyme
LVAGPVSRRPALLVAIFAATLGLGCQKQAAPVTAPPPALAPDAATVAAEPAQDLVRHQPGTLFGGELGLDHVGIAVRDLGVARRVYTETLGFGAPMDGTLANGLKNVTLYFADNGYLELLTATDKVKADWLAAFLEKTEGANFVLLSTWDLEETRAFLGTRGVQLTESAGGRVETRGVKPGTDPLWHTAFFQPPQVLPGGRVGFIAYRRDKRDYALSQVVKTLKVKRGPHPNSARLLKSAWMVVGDLEAAKKAYRDAGFEPLRAFEDARLKARGVELAAGTGKGTLLLLQPSDPKGPAAAFLARRGESLCGVSIEVMSLEKAVGHLQPKTGRTFGEYSGLYGRSILLPPELTFDLWMELYQP